MLGLSIQINPIGYINSHTSLNELESTGDLPEQRDLSLLSNKEKDEWKKFIIRELRLEENHLLNANTHLHEKVVQALMNNLKAIARNSHDFVRTDLAQMHIAIKAGSVPVRAQVCPLNPLQSARGRSTETD